MSKVYQLAIYKEISDPDKLAAYAEIAGPALTAAGGRFLSRGMPIGVQEHGEVTRTVLLEWDDIETAKAGFETPDYQRAIAALGDGAVRDIRYLEGL